MSFKIPDENVTEQDIITAESTGKAPVGKYVCTVHDLETVELVYMNPPCIGLKIKMTIGWAIEINKNPVQGKEVLTHAGKKIDDDVALFVAGEKDYARNRRLQIAKRFGILAKEGGKLTHDAWLSLIGKRIVVNYIQKRVKNKETGKYEPSDFNAVDMFNGYEPFVGSGPLESVSAPAPEQPAKSIDPSDI